MELVYYKNKALSIDRAAKVIDKHH